MVEQVSKLSSRCGASAPRGRRHRIAAALALWWLAGQSGVALADQGLSASELARMSIEELADIDVSSVSKRAEPLSEAAAAVYVITGDDIRRSGATRLPEALRLAPNLEVARVSANSWAISARGFNSTTANKLLVLIDGRTVYTPLFSGVFWDVQDVMLEDIDRIEVISGAGGTLWGSNAVNGVINIITKSAHDTRGTLVSAGAGNDERSLAARYGTQIGANADLRLYAKGFDRGVTKTEAGKSAQDAWRMEQGGFRLDGQHAGDSLTVQGDVYQGVEDQPGTAGRHLAGANLLGRWNRALAQGSSLQLLAYFDRTERTYPGVFAEKLDTWNFDAQHDFTLGTRQQIVWGGGYRLMRDHVDNGAQLAFLPADKDLALSNLFVQDTITLREDLKLTLGEKLEHNSYTGLESLPSARLAWKLDERRLLWASVARAVRTPSRIDTEFFVPGRAPFLLAGGPDFVSEKLYAYELGYRAQPSNRLSYTVSVFYNRYDQLRSVERNSSGVFVLDNSIEGHTVGVEAWGNYQAAPNWRLAAGFNALRERLHFADGSQAFGDATATSGNDPARQFQLRSSWDLPRALELDTTLRAVSRLPNPDVPGYVTMDARLGWHAGKHLDVALVGGNLLGHGHVESGAAPARSEIGRSLFVNLLWKN
jgi:iron complex outermembrane receptor protein